MSVKDDHLLMSLSFFGLPLRIGPNGRQPPWSSKPLYIWLYLGLNLYAVCSSVVPEVKCRGWQFLFRYVERNVKIQKDRKQFFERVILK